MGLYDGLRVRPGAGGARVQPGFGVEAPQPLTPIDEWELTKGLRRGMQGVQSNLRGFGAALQDPFAPEAAAENYRIARENMEQVTRENPLAVENFTDIKSAGDVLPWMGGAAGQAIPTIATGLVGGVGAKRGMGALSVGAGLAGRKGLQAALSNPLLNTGLGMGAGMLPMEGGEQAMTIQGDPVALANSTAGGRLANVLGKAAVNTVGEVVTPMFLMGKFGKEAVKGVGRGWGNAAKAVGTAAGEGVLGESGTEGLQNISGDVFTGMLNPQHEVDWQAALNAAAAGGVAGGGMGVGAGAGQATLANLPGASRGAEDRTMGDVLADATVGLQRKAGELSEKLKESGQKKADKMGFDEMTSHPDFDTMLKGAQDTSAPDWAQKDAENTQLVDRFVDTLTRGSHPTNIAIDAGMLQGLTDVARGDFHDAVVAYKMGQSQAGGDAAALFQNKTAFLDKLEQLREGKKFSTLATRIAPETKSSGEAVRGTPESKLADLQDFETQYPEEVQLKAMSYVAGKFPRIFKPSLIPSHDMNTNELKLALVKFARAGFSLGSNDNELPAIFQDAFGNQAAAVIRATASDLYDQGMISEEAANAGGDLATVIGGKVKFDNAFAAGLKEKLTGTYRDHFADVSAQGVMKELVARERAVRADPKKEAALKADLSGWFGKNAVEVRAQLAQYEEQTLGGAMKGDAVLKKAASESDEEAGSEDEYKPYEMEGKSAFSYHGKEGKNLDKDSHAVPYHVGARKPDADTGEIAGMDEDKAALAAAKEDLVKRGGYAKQIRELGVVDMARERTPVREREEGARQPHVKKREAELVARREAEDTVITRYGTKEDKEAVAPVEMDAGMKMHDAEERARFVEQFGEDEAEKFYVPINMRDQAERDVKRETILNRLNTQRRVFAVAHNAPETTGEDISYTAAEVKAMRVAPNVSLGNDVADKGVLYLEYKDGLFPTLVGKLLAKAAKSPQENISPARRGGGALLDMLHASLAALITSDKGFSGRVGVRVEPGAEIKFVNPMNIKTPKGWVKRGRYSLPGKLRVTKTATVRGLIPYVDVNAAKRGLSLEDIEAFMSQPDSGREVDMTEVRAEIVSLEESLDSVGEFTEPETIQQWRSALRDREDVLAGYEQAIHEEQMSLSADVADQPVKGALTTRTAREDNPPKGEERVVDFAFGGDTGGLVIQSRVPTGMKGSKGVSARAEAVRPSKLVDERGLPFSRTTAAEKVFGAVNRTTTPIVLFRRIASGDASIGLSQREVMQGLTDLITSLPDVKRDDLTMTIRQKATVRAQKKLFEQLRTILHRAGVRLEDAPAAPKTEAAPVQEVKAAQEKTDTAYEAAMDVLERLNNPPKDYTPDYAVRAWKRAEERLRTETDDDIRAALHAVSDKAEELLEGDEIVTANVNRGYIDTLDVDEKYRKRGLGELKVRSIEHVMRRNKIKQAFLLAEPDSIAFWEKMGYAVSPGHVEEKGENTPMYKDLSKESAEVSGAERASQAEVDAAVAEFERTVGDAAAVEFVQEGLIEKGKHISGQWQKKLIKISMFAKSPVGTLRHEVIHELFDWLKDNGSTATIDALKNAGTNTILLGKLKMLFKDDAQATKQLSNPEEAAAYLYQFWNARNEDGSRMIELGPQTETVFRKVLRVLTKLFGLSTKHMNESRNAEMIFKALSKGEFAGKNDAAMNIIEKKLAGSKLLREQRSAYDKAFTDRPWLKNLLFRSFTVLRDSGSKYLKETGEIFYKPFNERMKAGEQDQFSAVKQMANKYGHEVNRLYMGLTQGDKALQKQELELAVTYMNSRTPLNEIVHPQVRQFVRGARKLFQDMHDYARQAGVSVLDEKGAWKLIGEIKDYYPRQFDPSYLQGHLKEFTDKLIKHHADELDGLVQVAEQERLTQTFTGKYAASNTVPAGTPITREHIAGAIAAQIMNSGGDTGGESISSIGITPYASAVNHRSLLWLDDAAFAEFMSKDVLGTMLNYVHQMVKRAEATRRSGNGGEKIRQNFDRAYVEHLLGPEMVKELETELEGQNKSLTDKYGYSATVMAHHIAAHSTMLQKSTAELKADQASRALREKSVEHRLTQAHIDLAKSAGLDKIKLQEQVENLLFQQDMMQIEQADVAEELARRGKDGDTSRIDAKYHDLRSLANTRLKGTPEEMQAKIKKTNDFLADPMRVVMAMEGTLGRDINAHLRNILQGAKAYQSIRLLPLTLFTSFADVGGMVTNGAKVTQAFEAFTRGIKDVARIWIGKPPSMDVAAAIGGHIGLLEAGSHLSAVSELNGGGWEGAPIIRKINDTFFRWNGMEAWNRAMRLMGGQFAMDFIKRHLQNPGVHSRRLLEDIGIDPDKDYFLKEDLYDPNKKVSDTSRQLWLKAGELDINNPVVQHAIMRWVDGAVMNPNAAQRPTAFSDPHYDVFFQFKQFTYTFHSAVIERVMSEAEHGNLTPFISMMAVYAPIIVAADLIRVLLTSGDEPVWSRSVGGILEHAIVRVGPGGIPQMVTGDLPIVGKGRPARSLGPTIDQVISASMAAFTNEGSLTSEFLGALPAGNVARGFGPKVPGPDNIDWGVASDVFGEAAVTTPALARIALRK